MYSEILKACINSLESIAWAKTKNLSRLKRSKLEVQIKILKSQKKKIQMKMWKIINNSKSKIFNQNQQKKELDFQKTRVLLKRIVDIR